MTESMQKTKTTVYECKKYTDDKKCAKRKKYGMRM